MPSFCREITLASGTHPMNLLHGLREVLPRKSQDLGLESKLWVARVTAGEPAAKELGDGANNTLEHFDALPSFEPESTVRPRTWRLPSRHVNSEYVGVGDSAFASSSSAEAGDGVGVTQVWLWLFIIEMS